MAVTLTQLRSFLAVVRAGSVTGAADALMVTQPSVSAAVSALSREVGVELTERAGRGVRPSAAGTAFAPYAADVVGLLEQGRRAAREAAGLADRELRIAAVTTAGEHIVPAVMEAFRARRPDVHLDLYVGNRERVLERLRTHRADLGIGGRPPAEGGVQATRFLPNPTVIITRAGGPLGRRAIPLAELSDVPWLVREEGSGTRAMTEEFLAGHGLAPPVLTLGSNGAIKQGVRAGLGVSLQSRLAADPELGLGLIEAIRIREALPERHWHVLRAERGPPRPAADDFARYLLGPDARAAIEAAHRPAAG